MRCYNDVSATRVLSGQGTVYALSIVHKAGPGSSKAVPYILAYMQLDDGPTVMANLIGDIENFAIGDAVRGEPKSISSSCAEHSLGFVKA